MTMRLKMDGTTGRTAIYDTANGDAPFTSPLSNVSLLRFHSDLWSPAITPVSGVSVAFPARTVNTYGNATHTLFAHGLGGTPLVKGYVVISGIKVPLAGSVPIQTGTWGNGRVLQLGADSTNVFIIENWFSPYNLAMSPQLDAVTLTFYVYLTDVILDGAGAQTQPNEALTIDWSATLVKMGRGRVRSDHRYFRATSGTPEFVFPTGETISVVSRASHYTTSPYWRYSVNGYVQEMTGGDDNTNYGAQGFNAGTQGVAL